MASDDAAAPPAVDLQAHLSSDGLVVVARKPPVPFRVECACGWSVEGSVPIELTGPGSPLQAHLKSRSCPVATAIGQTTAVLIESPPAKR